MTQKIADRKIKKEMNQNLIKTFAELDPLTQMRIRIAKLQGWIIEEKPYGCLIERPNGDSRIVGFINPAMLGFFGVPNYPQCLEDAFSLLEDLIGGEFVVEIQAMPVLFTGWQVTIGGLTSARASTFEEAVCKAYIRFKEE